MKCEKCGCEINEILLDEFFMDGSDTEIKRPFLECDEDAVVIDTHSNWTGYELLTEEEQMETITCPVCHKFPFLCKDIQVYEIVRIVCFKSEEKKNDN